MNRFYFFLKAHLHYLIVFLVLTSFISDNFKEWKNYDEDRLYQFVTDRAIYYSYLPAFLINSDYQFKNTNQPGAYFDLHFGDKKMPKYTIGMAIMYSPFFLVAKALDPGTEELSRFGISKTFSFWLKFGSILYFMIGYFFMMKLLSEFFNQITVAATGILLFFGTNLTYYVLVESEMTHIYEFALIAAILYLTHQWWKVKKNVYLYLTAFLSGLLVLIRPTDIVVLLLPFFWMVTGFSSLKERIREILKNKTPYLKSVMIFIIPIIPQMLYWQWMSGEFILYTYENEHFFFTDPKIFDFLFSYRKGWFTYTPLMFLACLGFFLLPRYLHFNAGFLPLFIALNIYVFSSWYAWWFGGSFGQRVMIPFYSLMAFPLAALIQFSLKNFIKVITMTDLFVFFIFLNLNFSRKYTRNMIHWDSMTKESYWFMVEHDVYSVEDFGIFEASLDQPDYSSAKKGIGR